MLFQTLILGVVANIKHVILSNAASSLDSDLHYDDNDLFGMYQDQFLKYASTYTDAIDGSQRHTSFQNSQSEEDLISSSEELQSHLNPRDDLTTMDLDEKELNLDNNLDSQDHVAVIKSDDDDGDDSHSIQILLEKKKTTVNANTPVLVDKHHFMGLEKVLKRISKMLNITEDKEVGVNDNDNISSEFKYRYMQRIPKYLNIKDSKEEIESYKDNGNYHNENYYENHKTNSHMLHKQYPFLYTLHNMNSNENIKESTGNMNKEHSLIQDVDTIVPTEQKLIHFNDVGTFDNSNLNYDIEPYIISKQIGENPKDFVLDQSNDNFAMGSQILFANQGQNPLFVLDPIASENIDELQASQMNSNEQKFQLEDINSQLPSSDTLVPFEIFNNVLVNRGSQSVVDGDFLLEESNILNETIVTFAEDEIFSLGGIQTQREFESMDSHNFNLENSQMDDNRLSKSLITDEFNAPNYHKFTLEEFVSGTDSAINNLLDNPEFLLKDKVSSNITSSSNEDIIFFNDRITINLDEQAFILETSTSMSDLFYLDERPVLTQLSTNKIVTNADKQLYNEDEANSYINENLTHLDKEPFIYSVESNDTINLVVPIEYESTSPTNDSYQTHVHKVHQLISPYSKVNNTHSANQLPGKPDKYSFANSDNSVISNLVEQKEERNNHRDKIMKLTNEDKESEHHVFHLNPFIDDLEVMPVENIPNHYEIKTNNKSYYLIKVEKRPDKYNKNIQNQSKSVSDLDKKYNVSKQDSLTNDLLAASLPGYFSNDDPHLNDNIEISDEFSKITKLDLNVVKEEDITDKESRIFLTLDDVVDVLTDTFTDVLKTQE